MKYQKVCMFMFIEIVRWMKLVYSYGYKLYWKDVLVDYYEIPLFWFGISTECRELNTFIRSGGIEDRNSGYSWCTKELVASSGCVFESTIQAKHEGEMKHVDANA